jgi:hypothetical protein
MEESFDTIREALRKRCGYKIEIAEHKMLDLVSFAAIRVYDSLSERLDELEKKINENRTR